MEPIRISLLLHEYEIYYELRRISLKQKKNKKKH